MRGDKRTGLIVTILSQARQGGEQGQGQGSDPTQTRAQQNTTNSIENPESQFQEPAHKMLMIWQLGYGRATLRRGRWGGGPGDREYGGWSQRTDGLSVRWVYRLWNIDADDAGQQEEQRGSDPNADENSEENITKGLGFSDLKQKTQR